MSKNAEKPDTSVEGIVKSSNTPKEKHEKLKEALGSARMKLKLEKQQDREELMRMLSQGEDKEIEDFVGRKQAENEIKKLDKVDEIIGKIEDFDDLRKLPVSSLIKLEDRYEGILLYAFTDVVGGKEKPDFKNWQGYKELPEGTKLKVHFRGHKGAYDEIGAADILPPNVRGITVYTDGDDSKARTSSRRVALKGRNDDKSGFYDSRGYIPIFTGDVVEIKNNDKEFDKPYRKYVNGVGQPLDEEAYRKYEASQESKKDAEYIKTSEQNDTYVPKRVDMNDATIKEIREKIGGLEDLPPNDRIVKVAEFLVKPENKIYAKHCGDWVARVYEIAGIRRKKWIYHDIGYAFKNGKSGEWKDKDDASRYDCRESGKFASDARLNTLNPGDWIWVNNRNKLDNAGNHSVIFMGWKDKNSKIALVANWLSPKLNGITTTYNLKNMPVTHIDKPVGTSQDFKDLKQEKPSAQINIGYTNERLDASQIAYSNTRNINIMTQEYEQNLPKIQILKEKEKQLARFVRIAKANEDKYRYVADRTGIPWDLIAAIHYRESGMKFNTYLHNGDPLGSKTRNVPKGIYFPSEGEHAWEIAAIHALGGELTQEQLHGNKPSKHFQNMRMKLGINRDTQDLARMFTFAELYNGVGYRPKGVPTPYVYSGTNMYSGGLFYADYKFSRERSDRSLGVAAMLIALRSAS